MAGNAEREPTRSRYPAIEAFLDDLQRGTGMFDRDDLPPCPQCGGRYVEPVGESTISYQCYSCGEHYHAI